MLDIGKAFGTGIELDTAVVDPEVLEGEIAIEVLLGEELEKSRLLQGTAVG